jgi:glycosyl-4,4'-diaponeurosporenoate acyltransferase
VLVDAAVWAAWGPLVAWGGSRVPPARLAADNSLTRLRTWERSGEVYERLGIRRWKDHLPEAGGLFGGVPKRHLPGRSRRHLESFAAETRRGELVHWLVPLPVVAFPLWNPWWVTLVMAAYAVAANVPCLLVQRYNRSRIARLLPC